MTARVAASTPTATTVAASSYDESIRTDADTGTPTMKCNVQTQRATWSLTRLPLASALGMTRLRRGGSSGHHDDRRSGPGLGSLPLGQYRATRESPIGASHTLWTHGFG